MDEETRATGEGVSEAPRAVRVWIERRYVLDVTVPAGVVAEVLADADGERDEFSRILDAAYKVARIKGIREHRSADRVSMDWTPEES